MTDLETQLDPGDRAHGPVAAALCAQQLWHVYARAPTLFQALLGKLQGWLLWRPVSLRLLEVLQELITSTQAGPRYPDYMHWALRILSLPNLSPDAEASLAHRTQELDAISALRFRDLTILPLQAQRATAFHLWTDVMQATIPQHVPAQLAGLLEFAEEALRGLTPVQLLGTQLHHTREWARLSQHLRRH